MPENPELYRARADPTRQLVLDESAERDRMTLFVLRARLEVRRPAPPLEETS